MSSLFLTELTGDNFFAEFILLFPTRACIVSISNFVELLKNSTEVLTWNQMEEW